MNGEPDDENPEWTTEDFANASPAAYLPPEILSAFPNTKPIFWAIVQTHSGPEGDSIFNVSFPDIPGVSSTGSSFNEAVTRGSEALVRHFVSQAATGATLPVQRTISDLRQDPALRGLLLDGKAFLTSTCIGREDPSLQLFHDIEQADRDSSAARAHLAAGREVYYVEEDTPPGLLIKEHPDGRRDLVRFHRTGDEVIRTL